MCVRIYVSIFGDVITRLVPLGPYCQFCVCIYSHSYVYMCVYIYMHTYVHVCTCVYKYIYLM